MDFIFIGQEQVNVTARINLRAFNWRKMLEIYQPFRKKFNRKRRHRRLTKELIEWAVAVGLFCSIIGRWSGARLIDIGCVLEQFFLPLLKRFWHLATLISNNIHWS